jgi:hypothetical protein
MLIIKHQSLLYVDKSNNSTYLSFHPSTTRSHVYARVVCAPSKSNSTPGRLFLPAMDRARNVQCFASSPNEMRWPTDAAFPVEAGKPTAMSFNFRTMFDGRRYADTHSYLILDQSLITTLVE